MTLFIALLGLICVSLFVISVVWFRRLTALVIPLMFVVLFWATINVVNYIGYAVDAQYLDGVQATVLDSIEGSESIYLLVKIDKDKEPRLVRLPRTAQNQKDAALAREQAQKGLTVIRFGRSGTPGDQRRGTNQPPGDPASFRILNLAQTAAFSKDTAAGS